MIQICFESDGQINATQRHNGKFWVFLGSSTTLICDTATLKRMHDVIGRALRDADVRMVQPAPAPAAPVDAPAKAD